MTTFKQFKRQYNITEIDTKTSEKKAIELNDSSYRHGRTALISYYKDFPEKNFMTKERYFSEKEKLGILVMRKKKLNYILTKHLINPFCGKDIDVITDLSIILNSIENQDLSYLIQEVRIKSYNRVIFKYNHPYLNLDCVIPWSCFQLSVYIDIILSPDIIYYNNAKFNYECTFNYLNCENKLILEQNKYIISDNIGYIIDGKLKQKKTLEIFDDLKMKNLFPKIMKKKSNWEDELLGKKKHLYDGEQYILFLSNEYTVVGKNTAQIVNGYDNYLKFQLLDIDDNYHYFDYCFNYFSFLGVSYVSHSKEILIRCKNNSFELCYKLKSNQTHLHLKITHFNMTY